MGVRHAAGLRQSRGATGRDSAEQVMYGAQIGAGVERASSRRLSGDTVLTFDAATRFEFQGVRSAVHVDVRQAAQHC